jgi:hypothetical protein
MTESPNYDWIYVGILVSTATLKTWKKMTAMDQKFLIILKSPLEPDQGVDHFTKLS